MDIFEKYIMNNRDKEECRALTCKSYREVYMNSNHKELELNKTNYELATYGDALLKFALCHILLDKCNKLSEEKKKYESDEFLIEIIAKHYSLLDYIRFDNNIKGKEYKYYRDDINKETTKKKNKKTKKTKYIATAVEAILGAIYQETRDFDSICELVRSWIGWSEKAN